MSSNTRAETPPIGFAEKLGFCTFSTASNVVFNFKDLFYLFFLTNVMGIKIAHAGIITAIGIVWDAVNDPLVGFWAVNHRFKNGEMCRPLALWCAVPWAITTVLMFTCFDVAYGLKLGIAVAVYFLFELFNTFAAIPYNSMGSLATNRDSDRRAINVARNLGGCIGSAIGALALYPLLGLFGGLDEAGNVLQDNAGRRAFFFAAMVMGAVCIIGSLAHYFTTRERIHEQKEAESKIRFLDAVKMLLHCRSWVMNALYVICYGMLNLLIMSTINYYATYVLGSAAAATPILAVFLVMSVIATLLAIPIDKKIGRKHTMILSAAVYLAGKIWFILDPYSMGAIYVNSVTVAFSMALAFVCFNTNRNNIADLVEYQSGRRIDSLVSTCDNLAAKLSKAGTNLLMTGALAAAGFNADLPAQPQTAVNTICALLGWVPMLVAAVMLVVVCFHPIEKEMTAMERGKEA
ncbi:MAG: MFS transporter [Clostridiales bacterium]|nr:MFS transporter [Clostridiales bacterium]MDD7387240.1 MFS transporter [Bacillota bacterium]MDY6041098.1 MFS transporter [Candidatus Faecousia sp.]